MGEVNSWKNLENFKKNKKIKNKIRMKMKKNEKFGGG